MKQGQFSQEQIVAILQQAEKGEQTIQAIGVSVWVNSLFRLENA